VIEPSREMVQLIYERINFVDHDDSGIREGLVDVLALLERDYALVDRQAVDRPRCGYVHEVPCEFPEGHPGRHGRVRIEEWV
jgi:hypothetical protein